MKLTRLARERPPAQGVAIRRRYIHRPAIIQAVRTDMAILCCIVHCGRRRGTRNLFCRCCRNSHKYGRGLEQNAQLKPNPQVHWVLLSACRDSFPHSLVSIHYGQIINPNHRSELAAATGVPKYIAIQAFIHLKKRFDD